MVDSGRRLMEPERAQDAQEPAPHRSVHDGAESASADCRLRRDCAPGPPGPIYGLVFTDEFGDPLTGARITERRLRLSADTGA